MTKAWADALAEGDAVFSQRFGIPVEADWQGFPEVVPFLVEATRNEASPEWGPHLVFADDGALVGNGGWKGPPVDGQVELGYAVAPARQGRGIATAVVRELLARARASGVSKVVAHTLTTPSPSTSVLARCGFVKVHEVIHPEDGRVWRWEIALAEP